MSRSVRVTIVVAVAVLVSGMLLTAQMKDPFVGTWQMNVAKSKYTPGPMPKSVTTTIEAAGQGYKISVKNEPASGPMLQYSYTTALDGREGAVTGNNPLADVVTVTRIDASTMEMLNKKGGKTTTTQRSVVSTDGKTRTVTTSGNDAQGQKVSNVAVFEKQ